MGSSPCTQASRHNTIHYQTPSCMSTWCTLPYTIVRRVYAIMQVQISTHIIIHNRSHFIMHHHASSCIINRHHTSSCSKAPSYTTMHHQTSSSNIIQCQALLDVTIHNHTASAAIIRHLALLSIITHHRALWYLKIRHHTPFRHNYASSCILYIIKYHHTWSYTIMEACTMYIIVHHRTQLYAACNIIYQHMAFDLEGCETKRAQKNMVWFGTPSMRPGEPRFAGGGLGRLRKTPGTQKNHGVIQNAQKSIWRATYWTIVKVKNSTGQQIIVWARQFTSCLQGRDGLLKFVSSN